LVEGERVFGIVGRGERRGWERRTFGFGFVESGGAGCGAGDLEAIDFVGETVGGERAGRAHHVKVKVRRKRVAGVPYQAEDLAALDRIAWVNANFSLLKVSIERVAAVAEIEDYTIPVGFFDLDIGGILAGSLAWIRIGDGSDFGVGDGEGFLAVDGVALVLFLRAVVDAVLIVDLFPIDSVTLRDPDAAIHGKSGAGVTRSVTAGIGGNITRAAEGRTNHGDGLTIDGDVSTIFGEVLLAWRRCVGVKFDSM
jgi:hypothetical protein